MFVPKHFRMAEKNKAYYYAYAVSIFGWKCIICNFKAQDQIGLENSWLADEKVVYTDQLDQSKWVFCNICKKSFHLAGVMHLSEEQVDLKGWLFKCTFNQCNKIVSF